MHCHILLIILLDGNFGMEALVAQKATALPRRLLLDAVTRGLKFLFVEDMEVLLEILASHCLRKY